MQIIIGLSIAFALILVALILMAKGAQLSHGSYRQMLLGYPMFFGGLCMVPTAMLVSAGTYERLILITTL